MMSPSWTTYVLPSSRYTPWAFASFVDPTCGHWVGVAAGRG